MSGNGCSRRFRGYGRGYGPGMLDAGPRRLVLRSVALAFAVILAWSALLSGSGAMPAGARFRAVLDRVEGDTAILENFDNERERLEMPVRLLPACAREGDVVNVNVAIDVEETRRRREAAKACLNRLLRRKGAG
ncbi:MAG TPA: DUF3006 domain-containing protein [Firmicutes bacterium]|nr:DUF3006 domain-containing protein [Bacillota bacterium]